MATETVQVFADGQLVDEYQITVPDEMVNERTLRDQANTALANNAAYLALPSPTQAQAIAQVEALTRQVNKIIRLVLGRLEDTE